MHLQDLLSLESEVVLNGFDKLLTHQSRMNAAILIHIAVIDSRNLFLARGFESMRSYLMSRMDLTEDAAYKRLQVARLARQIPQLFPAIADGRLTMKSVRMIATRLTNENAEELLNAVAHKSATEIQLELARRFPQAEPMRLDDGLPPQVVVTNSLESVPVAPGQPDLAESVPPISNTPRVRTKIDALSATRNIVRVGMSDKTLAKLRRLQDLLAHAVPDRDVEEIVDRAFDALIEKTERRKFGVGTKEGRKPAVRSIPAQIKKAVYDRDQGRCTHLYLDGRRCPNTASLEFDHKVPVAKGGKTTVDNLRLLCRAHNQHAADQEFGQAFMDAKRASRRPFAGAPKGSRRGSGPIRSRS